MGVTENHTNLRGGGTLLCKLADLLDDLFGGSLEPAGGVSEYIRCSGFPWILGQRTSWGESESMGLRTRRYPFHWSEDDPFSVVFDGVLWCLAGGSLMLLDFVVVNICGGLGMEVLWGLVRAQPSWWKEAVTEPIPRYMCVRTSLTWLKG